mmetsp:Transcript_63095/g.135488  ORF Transcript_63095/g.135488 Transcript_63095/m.135488 type:complete len:229 (-) Transcript_63095:262-948(-)
MLLRSHTGRPTQRNCAFSCESSRQRIGATLHRSAQQWRASARTCWAPLGGGSRSRAAGRRLCSQALCALRHPRGASSRLAPTAASRRSAWPWSCPGCASSRWRWTRPMSSSRATSSPSPASRTPSMCGRATARISCIACAAATRVEGRRRQRLSYGLFSWTSAAPATTRTWRHWKAWGCSCRARWSSPTTCSSRVRRCSFGACSTAGPTTRRSCVWRSSRCRRRTGCP